jgi:hypothetical protein
MNTIPSIFNERQINRTVLGGTEKCNNVQMPVSVILLNSSGSHFRIQMLENILKCGFESVISMEKDPQNYNIENFSRRFPSVQFIIPLEETTDGDLINIGMAEVKSDYVLVLRDTLHLPPAFLLPRLALRILHDGQYCIVPRLISDGGQGLPVQFIPSVARSRLSVTPSVTVTDGMPTLYPFDYIGLYNRRKFIQLGGFDYTIIAPHWQNLDLSFRAWLWGEQITLSTSFQLAYAVEAPEADSTINLSHTRFYLKNLVPRYKVDHGIVPKSAFFVFLPRSGCGFFETVNQFRDVDSWVKKNKFRFRMDAKYLVENWGRTE